MRLAQLGIDKEQDLQGIQERQVVLDIVSVVNGLGGDLFLSGQVIAETKASYNALWLASGLQGGFALSAPFTTVLGGSGAQIGATALLSETAFVQNVQFVPQSGSTPCAVVRGVGKPVVFQNCVFLRGRSLAQSLVQVADGGKVVFIGCTFMGSGLAQCVANPGAMADVQWIGCVNLTGASAGNVTETGTV